MKTHFQYIDRLKGLAILCVIMGHFVLYSLGHKDILFVWIGSFHMPLFMFLSGLVIAEIPKTTKNIKKMVALIMPFIVLGALYAVFQGHSFIQLLCRPLKYGYWYLFVLAAFYAMLQLLRLVHFRGGKIIAAVAIFVVLHLLNLFVSKNINDIFSLWVIRQYWPFFIAGYFFRCYHVLDWIKSRNWTYTAGIVLYAVAFFYYMDGNKYLLYPMALSFIIAICYLFIHRENCNTWIDRQLGFLGRNTLDIYIYHMFIISVTHIGAVGTWLAETSNVFLEVLLALLFAVVVAYVCVGIGKVMRKSSIISDVVYADAAKRWLPKK